MSTTKPTNIHTERPNLHSSQQQSLQFAHDFAPPRPQTTIILWLLFYTTVGNAVSKSCHVLVSVNWRVSAPRIVGVIRQLCLCRALRHGIWMNQHLRP